MKTVFDKSPLVLCHSFICELCATGSASAEAVMTDLTATGSASGTPFFNFDKALAAIFIVMYLVPVGSLIKPAHAQDYQSGSLSSGRQEAGEDIFGDSCDGELPKTLFQWSVCPTFEGGPDRDEPLVTDRPDFTEASSTVGLGTGQLEMGYTYTYDQSGTDRQKTHSYPETLLRVGLLAEWLELRVGWNYAEETTTISGNTTKNSGSEDLYLGLKIGLTPQVGRLPEMALIPQMFVPAGSDAFSAGETLPGLAWIYGWEVNDCISTAGQTQVNRRLDDSSNDPYLEFSQSWTVGYSLTEKVGAYTEWYVLIPDGADTAPTEHFFNGGFTLLINNDLQIDIRAGLGLSRRAADYFVGTGLAYRF